MRERTSPIWTIPIEEFREIIKSANSISKILESFGLKNIGSNYRTLRARIEKENIDDSHIPRGYDSNKGREFKKEAIDLCLVLIQNSNYSRSMLKNRLLKESILKNVCSICNIEPTWNEKPLIMVLDHINGVRNDNRLSNLRLICPNCNSQTDTFAGKNRKKSFDISHQCKCGNKKSKASVQCCECLHILRRKVKQRPHRNKLLEEIDNFGYRAVSKLYGVSDTTIRKWIALD
jgi:hypothetical protein